MSNLNDVQSNKPDIEIPIGKVGISDLKLPIRVLQKNGDFQNIVATINCFVDLPKSQKGVHMSRIPIVLNQFLKEPLDKKKIRDVTNNIRETLNSSSCYISYKFDYFIKKNSPVNKIPGYVYYNIIFIGEFKQTFDFIFLVEVVATSLCPCSKEISKNGAHNQKCVVRIICNPETNEWIWVEDIIELIEGSVSCDIYSILKRSDEAYVTEKAYDNPMFVEDIARSCYQKMKKLKTKSFIVDVISDESIHQHNAHATIVYPDV